MPLAEALPQAVPAASAPNFLIIVADDLDAMVSPYWDALPQTAALIRDKGFTFNQTFATTPTCCPARANILSGKYAHNTGVFSNFGINGGLLTFQAGGHESQTVAVHLDNAGYNTGFIGKYLNEYASQPNHIPPGWDDWFAFSDNAFYDGYTYDVNDNGTFVTYGSDPDDYSTDVVSRRLLDFLDAANIQEGPFLSIVMPTAPHLPLLPAPRHASHPWVGATRPVTPNYYEADMSDKPWWLRTAAPLRAGWRPFINGPDFQNRMGSLLAQDELVAAAVAKLDAQGELDNTYIVFTSDNGYNMGAHGLVDKLVPYEESVRIPMVITGPSVPVGSTPHLVGLIDLFPTVLDLAGVPIPSDVDGRSMRPLWSTPSPVWRSDILFEYKPTVTALSDPNMVWFWSLVFDSPGYRAVRTQQYVLIRWWDGEIPGAPGFHEWELYDIQADPQQLNNLLAAPNGYVNHARTLSYLLSRLATLERCSGATCQ